MASLEPDRETVLQSASPQLKLLLKELHSEHCAQENSWARKWYEFKFFLYALSHPLSRESWNIYNDRHLSGQYLSHSKEKCELLYMLARLNQSTNIVECGTSFGLSTIYLALAALQNDPTQEAKGTVVTIEKDTTKLARAREIWKIAGPDIEQWINPIDGDLLEVLAKSTKLPETVDLLFLDAWTSLALPTLKMVLPQLRKGSIVIADKTASGKALYQDLLDFVREGANCFMSVTLPFPEGLEIIVYSP